MDLVFPPTGTAYRQNSQSHYIWRWLGLHAPDLVIVVSNEDFGLTNALKQNRVAGVGSIPALRAASTEILRSIPKQIAKSEAHLERDRRLARTPRQLAEELSKIYGHDFDPPIYIPAMALIARVRLGQQADVAALVAPYLDGAKDSLARKLRPAISPDTWSSLNSPRAPAIGVTSTACGLRRICPLISGMT